MNPNTPIESIMSTRLVTVRPPTPLEEVAGIFAKNTFHHLPVTDGQGILVGIISRQDFAKANYLLASKGDKSPSKLSGICAADLMSIYPMSLLPEDSIGLAADIFLANKFHALPVLEGGILVGLITTHDLIAHCFNSPLQENETIAWEED